MINRFLVVLLVFFNIALFSQDADFYSAKELFDDQKYSAAQSLFQKILNSKNDQHSAYYNARCSKELFLKDAIELYNQYQKDYPYSMYLNNVYEDLALIYYRQKLFHNAITYFEKIKNIEIKNNY